MTPFADDPDWKRAWDPVLTHIGERFSSRGDEGGIDPDPVEAGAIRRYLEPLELDCPLHWDGDVARSCGFANVIAPYTATVSFAIGPMWLPGMTLFTSDDRNAQPERSSVRPELPRWFPPITGYFATDIEVEFCRPATIGDVVRMRPGALLSCEPKETSIGRGAFITSETFIVNQHSEPLGRMVSGTYFYQPHPRRRP